MNFKNILIDLLKVETVEAPRGQVSEAIIAEAKRIKEEAKLEIDISKRIDEIVALVKNEFKGKDEQLSQAHKKNWDRITAELELDPDKEYRLQISNGTVYEILPKDQNHPELSLVK